MSNFYNNDVVLYEIKERTHLGYIVSVEVPPCLQSLSEDKLLRVQSVWIAGSNGYFIYNGTRSIKSNLVRLAEIHELRVFKNQVLQFILDRLYCVDVAKLIPLVKQAKFVLGSRSWKRNI